MQLSKVAILLSFAALISAAPVVVEEKRMAVGNENLVVGSGQPFDFSWAREREAGLLRSEEASKRGFTFTSKGFSKSISVLNAIIAGISANKKDD